MKIQDLESMVRSGDFARVSKMISEANLKKIPRADLARFANVANRVDRGQLAFRLLNPVVRGETSTVTTPSDEERLEYAETLRRMGLANEALGILVDMDARRKPLVKLRMVFCLFSLWRYGDSLPLLKDYLETADPEDYLTVVARVNLAAALVFQRKDDDAIDVLNETLRTTRGLDLWLLHGNCLELLAQVYIHKKDWARAFEALEMARKAFPDAETKYSHFLFKWSAIAKSLQARVVHEDLRSCRQQAEQRNDWETLRECDLYIGVVDRNQPLLHRVYFGTPYDSYRERIKARTGDDLQLPEHYLWRLSGEPSNAETFDALSGRYGAGESQLEQGQLMHRTMLLLCSDFYRPISIGGAFSALFPDEHFQQLGSANRVVQVIKRLRAWFKDQNAGVAIFEANGKYRLAPQHPLSSFAVRIPREVETAKNSKEHLVWKNVTEHIPSEMFTKQDVIRVADFSVSSAKRLLSWAIDAGQIEVVGGGRQRRYKRVA